jgi:hypothetical protein
LGDRGDLVDWEKVYFGKKFISRMQISLPPYLPRQ